MANSGTNDGNVGIKPTVAGDWAPWSALPPSISRLQQNLADEVDRRKSLEQRGVAVVTASAAFVTLIFAITAHAVFSTSAVFRDTERASLTAALAFFALSALAGVLTNSIVQGQVENPRELAPYYQQIETATSVDEAARNTISNALISIVEIAYNSNQGKARWLLWAIRLQIAALVLLGLGTAFIMARVS
jgi:hypothetical protein